MPTISVKLLCRTWVRHISANFFYTMGSERTGSSLFYKNLTNFDKPNFKINKIPLSISNVTRIMSAWWYELLCNLIKQTIKKLSRENIALLQLVWTLLLKKIIQQLQEPGSLFLCGSIVSKYSDNSNIINEPSAISFGA